MTEIGFIEARGISYEGALSRISKSEDPLQPIYEAFTNSLESINLSKASKSKNYITVRLYFTKNLLAGCEDFDSLEIEDSGIGFNEKEFNRFIDLHDKSKSSLNLGSGRVQFLHYFAITKYESIFKENSSTNGFQIRKFTLSKTPEFLKNNSIIYHNDLSSSKAKTSKTKVTFSDLFEKQDQVYYNILTLPKLKDSLINKNLEKFCAQRESLPAITLEHYIGFDLKDTIQIKSEDIPQMHSQKEISIHYSQHSSTKKVIEKIKKSEKFVLKCFKISKDKLAHNGLKLTNKGEISTELKLEKLRAEDQIEGQRYLFLLSGNYIDKNATDTRGLLNIPTAEQYKKSFGETASLIKEPIILLDDIEEKANETILDLCNEIMICEEKKKSEIEDLRKMFMIDQKTIEAVTDIKISDTDAQKLEKYYRVEVNKAAKLDAEIKRIFDSLDKLNPSDENFSETFIEEVNKLTVAIPLQNRAQLTHYVARRAIVLDLFEKILEHKLNIQKSGKSKKSNQDEALIHNLLFQKGSDKPENSDLWLINEDFIYFSGSSEKQFAKLEINGERFLKDEFSVEEERYLKSLGKNRLLNKPDVLLFPEEGKCIILEFKAPNVDASKYLTQIEKYAYLILNYSNKKFKINTFYGYLIGENIEPKDVKGSVGRYEHAYHFDYLFRPSEAVSGDDGQNGSIYTEVIKYSTLLKRAKKRNSIFIDKLKNAK